MHARTYLPELVDEDGYLVVGVGHGSLEYRQSLVRDGIDVCTRKAKTPYQIQVSVLGC